MTSNGWQYEADPRHAEVIIHSLRLTSANGAKAPGEDSRPIDDEENDALLTPVEGREYRAAAARANYLAQDRCDIQFAAKEVCRGMSAPTKGNFKALRRLARYLIAVPRVVWDFAWQVRPQSLYAFSDSDWAGCRRTARSTSGGVIMLGTHCIRSYSVTQKHVTLSSAEAELMALVKAAAESIGLCQLAAGWGIPLLASIFVDSSAALAVTHRQGNGRLRHVRIGHLWVQELAQGEEVRFHKVHGEVNPADLLTKHLPPGRREKLIHLVSQRAQSGQASARIQLNALHSRAWPTLKSFARTLPPHQVDGQDRNQCGSRWDARNAFRVAAQCDMHAFEPSSLGVFSGIPLRQPRVSAEGECLTIATLQHP